MPNWCHNRVTITWDDEESEKKIRKHINIPDDLFETDIEDDVFSFDHMVPMPEELKSVQTGGGTTICTQEEYDNWKPSGDEWRDATRPITQEMADDYKERFGSENWYDWAYINWGVKWNRSDAYLNCNDGDMIEISFETAWGPAEGIYNRLREWADEEKVGLNISWFYDEPGEQFAGYLGN
tara:strand:- start:171 stop:713 length:543 start_codon:yes stop_codon:yes gene_type:complete